MPVMDPNRREDSGEMYSPDDQGEYTSLDETPQFSLQGLSDTLMDTGEETGRTSMEEYALMLEAVVDPGFSIWGGANPLGAPTSNMYTFW